MENEIKNLEAEFKKEIQAAGVNELEAIRIKYLGRKSSLGQLFSRLPILSKEEKIRYGRELNLLKGRMESLIGEKIESTGQREERVDLTFPPAHLEKGSLHVLRIVNKEICSIFEKLGFTVIEGKEVEDEWHNFEALNIPLEHPSRDAFDTFYLDLPKKDTGKWLLRSHTSPSQVRVMQRKKPPLAVISPGRVYRPDEVDASHSFMFHQVEGFAVDTDINFSHLKGILLYFAQEFFSPQVSLRFRPHFFPFTEPSAEVDISCFNCMPHARRHKSHVNKCSICKGKGWLEILGCGMIHPKVLEACKIDAKKYRGFAFGMGVDRIAMLKYGIDDIRLFYENDVRFLEQFAI
jgi:phenylalanyl-tRNA synthetase alpha chain